MPKHLELTAKDKVKLLDVATFDFYMDQDNSEKKPLDVRVHITKYNYSTKKTNVVPYEGMISSRGMQILTKEELIESDLNPKLSKLTSSELGLDCGLNYPLVGMDSRYAVKCLYESKNKLQPPMMVSFDHTFRNDQFYIDQMDGIYKTVFVLEDVGVVVNTKVICSEKCLENLEVVQNRVINIVRTLNVASPSKK